jgi:hypothetical protein
MYEIVLVMILPECAAVLSPVQFEKLQLFMSQAPLTTLMPILNRASKTPPFQASVASRIGSQSHEVLATLVKYGIQQPVVDRAVALYSNAGSWEYANTLSKNLIIPVITHLRREHIETIINSAGSGQSDLAGSHGFGEFTRAIRAEKVIEASELDAMLEPHASLSSYLSNARDFSIPIDDDIPF